MEVEGSEEQPGCDGIHPPLWPGQASLPPGPRHLFQGSRVLPPRHPRGPVWRTSLPILQG